MSFLAADRECLERHLPGLDKQLADLPLDQLEKPGNPSLALFRDAGGPALMIPPEYGGLGTTGTAAVRIQRAIGSRSPSLAVASTMHHFSVASLVELTATGNGFEWAMLQAIAENRWLMSSGFAEGKPGAHILTPTMTARRDGTNLVITGRKKPCSLTWSMDLLSASVAVSDPDGGADRLAVVLVPAASPGIERLPFWGSPVLAGAESDEIVLTDVVIPEQLAFYPQDGESMDPLQARGFAWFELLVTASYVGAASGLVERVLTAGRGGADERVSLVAELESVMAALDSAATALAAHGGDPGAVDGDLARVLLVRYAAERTLERVAMGAAALVGGMGFIGSGDVAYLLAACRPLSYHPPSRAAAAEPLARYLAGGALVL